MSILTLLNKLEELRDKVRELEQSLSDSDNSKQDLLQEKDRSIWEMQKTQKVNIKKRGFFNRSIIIIIFLILKKV